MDLTYGPWPCVADGCFEWVFTKDGLCSDCAKDAKIAALESELATLRAEPQPIRAEVVWYDQSGEAHSEGELTLNRKSLREDIMAAFSECPMGAVCELLPLPPAPKEATQIQVCRCPGCKACREVGMSHCAHPEDCGAWLVDPDCPRHGQPAPKEVE